MQPLRLAIIILLSRNHDGRPCKSNFVTMNDVTAHISTAQSGINPDNLNDNESD